MDQTNRDNGLTIFKFKRLSYAKKQPNKYDVDGKLISNN